MDINESAIHVLIAVVGLIGSGASVFIGLKVGLAESKKDIIFLTAEGQRLTRIIEKHIDSATHPTADQIAHIQEDVKEMKVEVAQAHAKLEHNQEKALLP